MKYELRAFTASFEGSGEGTAGVFDLPEGSIVVGGEPLNGYRGVYRMLSVLVPMEEPEQ